MKRLLAAVFFIFIAWISKGQDLTVYRSDKGVVETAKFIEKAIIDQGLVFFNTISYDSVARTRGKQLQPTRSILFEDPELVTELLSCQQTVALDLPLEIIVWEENGDVYIGYMDPRFMLKRFMVSGCDNTLDALSKLMLKVIMNAIRQL